MLMLLSTLALASAEKDDNGEENEETPPSIEEEVEDWTHYAGPSICIWIRVGRLGMVIEADDWEKYIPLLKLETVFWKQDTFGAVIEVRWSFALRNPMTKSSLFRKIPFILTQRAQSPKPKMQTLALPF